MSYFLYRRSTTPGNIILQTQPGDPDPLYVELGDGRFLHNELIGTEFQKSITEICKKQFVQ